MLAGVGTVLCGVAIVLVQHVLADLRDRSRWSWLLVDGLSYAFVFLGGFLVYLGVSG